MKIITIPDSILFQTSSEVTFPLSSDDRDLIDAMIAVCKGTHDNPKKLVGISAPQLGALKRIILVDVAADGKGKTGDLRVMINPVNTSTGPSIEYGPEGCGSIPGVAGIIGRPSMCYVFWHDLVGKKFQCQFDGFRARIFYHELDHLNGILFPDRLKPGTKLHEIRDDEFPVYRKGSWETWDRFMPDGWWANIKSQAGL